MYVTTVINTYPVLTAEPEDDAHGDCRTTWTRSYMSGNQTNYPKYIALDPNSLVPDCYWDNEPGRGNTVHSSPVRRMREIACRVRVSV